MTHPTRIRSIGPTVLCSLLAAVCAVAAPELPKPPPGVAALTGITGTVEVRRADAPDFVPVTYTTLLAPGDQVRTGKDSRAELVIADGQSETLRAETILPIRSQVRGGRPFTLLRKQLGSVLSPEARPLDLRGYLLRGHQLRGAGSGGAGEEAPLLAAEPRSSTLGENRPVFRWTALPKTTDLRLTLYDAGEKVIWWSTPDAGSGSQEYPADAAALAPGEYIWELTGEVDGRRELSAARFTVPRPDDLRQTQDDIRAVQTAAPGGRPLLQIAVWLEHSMFAPAESALLEARKASPGDRTLALLLARVYSETHRTVPGDLRASITGR